MNLLLALTVPFLLADVAAPTRLDLASEPAGATVLIDGVDRGLTPMTLFDVKPGAHRLKFRLAGYVDQDRFLRLEPGQPNTQSVLLEAEKGILLLQSDPAGADIAVGDISIGQTPRLVTDLDAKDVHRITLTAAGFRPTVIDVKFNGRKPVVRNEKLVRDAGVLDITTDPPGASVIVNGVERGKTPVTVSDIPKGRASVKIELEGYDPESREISVVAGEKQTMAVSLKALPGTLILSSDPDGARIYVNDAFQGLAPCTVKGLKPGTYTVRAEKKGFATLSREVEVKNGSMPREEFRLSNILGRLELRTTPPGAQVIVDGRVIGTTKASNATDLTSDPFFVESLAAGEHSVVVKRRGNATVAFNATIEQEKTFQKTVRMKTVFTPDTRITTSSGSFEGILVKRTFDYVVIEVKPGVEKSVRSSDIRKFESLVEP